MLAGSVVPQVHDELLLGARWKEPDETRALVRDWMESAVPSSVSLEVEVGHGTSWIEA